MGALVRTEVLPTGLPGADPSAAVGILTMDRPDRLNAFTNEMESQFWAGFSELLAHPDVRAIVWRGEGRAFSTGRDTAELGAVRPDGMSDYQFIRLGHGHTHANLIPSRVPIVCAIQGWCIGGSFERALLCDLRVASEDARFRLPELAHGVIPDSGGTARLIQMCGHGLTLDLTLTGRVLDAEEALRHGIVSRVVARDDLDTTVLDMANAIAALPPLAVRVHREIVDRLANETVADSVRQELAGQMLVYQSEDRAEASAARAESRPPNYRTT